MVLTKILLIMALVIVFLQDFKDRHVYWFLFPIIAVLCGFLFYKNTLPELFITSMIMNGLFILILVFVLWLYAKFKLETKLLNTIGIGDILLFIALTVSFSTVTFLIIFIGALFFSLILHFYKTVRTKKRTTVPLAGYMSLFFLISYLFQWAGIIISAYKI